eukprot:UN27908
MEVPWHHGKAVKRTRLTTVLIVSSLFALTIFGFVAVHGSFDMKAECVRRLHLARQHARELPLRLSPNELKPLVKSVMALWMSWKHTGSLSEGKPITVLFRKSYIRYVVRDNGTLKSGLSEAFVGHSASVFGHTLYFQCWFALWRFLSVGSFHQISAAAL